MIFPVEIWGTVGQWASAVFSGASVLVALSIVRRDRQKDDWINARKVSSWVGFGSNAPAQKPDGTNPPRTWVLDCTCTNSSDYPVFDVVFKVTPKPDSHLKDRAIVTTEKIATVEPNSKKTVRVTVEGPDASMNHLAVADMVTEVMEFRSENGVLWERGGRSSALRKADEGWCSRISHRLK